MIGVEGNAIMGIYTAEGNLSNGFSKINKYSYSSLNNNRKILPHLSILHCRIVKLSIELVLQSKHINLHDNNSKNADINIVHRTSYSILGCLCHYRRYLSRFKYRKR